jgi:hypothetical protein
MRKASATLVAVIIGVAGFVACQSADRNPVGVSAEPSASSPDGAARAAAEPIPVPGGPGSIPVPGKGGSGTTTVPVPGAPNKGGVGGGGGGGGSTPGGTPSPGATPTPPPPALVTVTFTSGDVPKQADQANPSRIFSTLPVSGINGDITELRVALKATIPNNGQLRIIKLLNPLTAPDRVGAALYDFSSEFALTGSNIGTGCQAYSTAATFDDNLGGGLISQSAPPYTGTFKSNPNGSLASVAGVLRFPSHANGNWTMELDLLAGAVATLDCWSLTIIYQPAP